jgi:uncharacterized protein (UPF0332 family)
MNKEMEFPVKMTLNQFSSLDIYFKNHDIITEVLNTPHFHSLKMRKVENENKIKEWLFNGWNTEHILRTTNELLKNQDNSFVIQWSFPQAYYSVYLLTLSYIYLYQSKPKGHKGVMKKFNEFIKFNKYPKMISFYCEGTKNNPVFMNITKHESSSSVSFDPTSIESCQTQICQFLKSTREYDLNIKKGNMDGSKQQQTDSSDEKEVRLNEKVWINLSNKIGVTSIYDLLYRKRIKSNYKDINTFTSNNMNAKQLNENLIGIVNTLNFIHESYLYKILGNTFLDFYKEFSNQKNISFLDNRIEMITNRL